MALIEETYLSRLEVVVDRTDGRVIGMHVVEEVVVMDGSRLVSSHMKPARPLALPDGSPDWAALIAIMHPDDLAALGAAAAGP